MIYRYTRIAHRGAFPGTWRARLLRGRLADARLSVWEAEGGALAPNALGRKDYAAGRAKPG